MVESLSASGGQAGRYLDNTPEHPYIPYDTPSARGRARIGSRSDQDETGDWSPGGISAVIRENPVPFVLFAASAGILLAAWMGYRRYGAPSARRPRLWQDPERHHQHVSDDRGGRAAGRSPDPDQLIGAGRSGKSAGESASVLLGPDGRPVSGSSATTSSGSGSSTVTVGWATPDGSASHSDSIPGEAADALGQTNRENPPPGRTAGSPRT